MRSSIEGLLIVIGDELKPYVQNIAEVIGDWARKFTELDDSTKKIIISVGAFAAAIGPAAIALSTIISVGRNLITVFRGLAIAKGLFSAALWASPITWIIAGIVALIAAGVWLVRNWDTVKDKAGELWSFIKGVWNKLVKWTKRTFSNIWKPIKETWDNVWNKTKEIWDDVKESISDAMDSAKEKVTEFFSPLLDFIGSAKDGWDKLVGALKSFKLPEPVRKIASGVGNFVGGLIPGAYHGEDYVPRDNMLYRLHKGEMVLPRQEAQAYREGRSGAAKWAINKVTSGLGGLRDLGGQVASSFARGFNSATDGSHYHGLDYVPRDGYRANLHRGEMVLPRQEAQAYR